MNTHRRTLTCRWALLAGAAVLVLGHGMLLHYGRSHMTVRTAAVSGVVLVLLAVKHVGLLGGLLGSLHSRRSHRVRQSAPSDEGPP